VLFLNNVSNIAVSSKLSVIIHQASPALLYFCVKFRFITQQFLLVERRRCNV